MPPQDRVRGDQAMATQRAGQALYERGEHGPVRPVQARSRVGAAKHGDFVAQHEELDVLGGGRTTRQQNQPEHLPEDQIEQPQRHAGIMSDRRSPLVSDPGPTSGTPQAVGRPWAGRDEACTGSWPECGSKTCVTLRSHLMRDVGPRSGPDERISGRPQVLSRC
jgi:hypothetical protein